MEKWLRPNGNSAKFEKLFLQMMRDWFSNDAKSHLVVAVARLQPKSMRTSGQQVEEVPQSTAHGAEIIQREALRRRREFPGIHPIVFVVCRISAFVTRLLLFG